MHPDAFTDCERDAYVDGEIDLTRRFAIEDHCAATPADAASLFADLRARTALKLAQPGEEDAPVRLLAAASRLEKRLDRGRKPHASWRGWAGGAIAAVAVMAVTTFTLLPRDRSQPAYIRNAMVSYQTGMLRMTMASQIESQAFDAQDIARNIKIRVPVLPAGWRISDVQVFPSDQGAALQLLVRTGDNRTVSIFAVRTAEYAPTQPIILQEGKMTVAYWRQGAVAYALIGAGPAEQLGTAAQDLADNTLA